MAWIRRLFSRRPVVDVHDVALEHVTSEQQEIHARLKALGVQVDVIGRRPRDDRQHATR